jgi:hypothetical protein
MQDSNISTISPQEALTKMQKGTVMVDVREYPESTCVRKANGTTDILKVHRAILCRSY